MAEKTLPEFIFMFEYSEDDNGLIDLLMELYTLYNYVPLLHRTRDIFLALVTAVKIEHDCLLKDSGKDVCGRQFGALPYVALRSMSTRRWYW